jgi:exosortase family protein XrtG
MSKDLLFIMAVLLWIFALIFFKQTKMNFFKFLVGSVGIFTITMIFLMPYLENRLGMLVSNSLYFMGNETHYFEVFKENAIISIDAGNGIVSMIINYECSGVIEMLVFTSLALFFPFGGLMRRTISVFAGNLLIYVSNIIRVLFIILMTKLLGAQSFYIVHTLLARILFFGLMIVVYYFVFTTTHLKYQNVGDIK